MFPDTKLAVFGVDNEKLANFAFADATYRVTDIPEGLLVDHAFECVGGAASQSAIDQIIDHIQPRARSVCLAYRSILYLSIPGWF